MIRPHLRTNKYNVLAKNNILGSWLIACCKFVPTLARQMWRHNYVIGFNEMNEYLISYIHRNFCLNPLIIHIEI